MKYFSLLLLCLCFMNETKAQVLGIVRDTKGNKLSNVAITYTYRNNLSKVKSGANGKLELPEDLQHFEGKPQSELEKTFLLGGKDFIIHSIVNHTTGPISFEIVLQRRYGIIRVMNNDSDRLKGIRFRLKGKTYVTNEAGEARVEFLPNTRQIVGLDGFFLSRLFIPQESKEFTTFILLAEKGKNIKGTVLQQETELPVANAKIDLLIGNQKFTGKTDGKGKYSISLPKGMATPDVFLFLINNQMVNSRQLVVEHISTDLTTVNIHYSPPVVAKKEMEGVAKELMEQVEKEVLKMEDDLSKGVTKEVAEIDSLKKYIKYLEEELRRSDIAFGQQISEKYTRLEQELKHRLQLVYYNLSQQQRDLEKVEQDKFYWKAGTLSVLFFIVPCVLAFIFYRHSKKRQQLNKGIEAERQKVESLLLNILPKDVASELKEKGTARIRTYSKATVLFSDFKGFTQIASEISPEELIDTLNECFSAFDEIVEKRGLEKIKTIGDAYMCAGGLPQENLTNPVDAVLAGLEIQAYMKEWKATREANGQKAWGCRVGINTGEVVAGVVGKYKYAYDVWSDTVNTASRMESNGEDAKVNISEQTYQEVKDFFDCEYRGKVSAKGKGEINMYFVQGIKSQLSEDGVGKIPNDYFWYMMQEEEE